MDDLKALKQGFIDASLPAKQRPIVQEGRSRLEMKNLVQTHTTNVEPADLAQPIDRLWLRAGRLTHPNSVSKTNDIPPIEVQVLRHRDVISEGRCDHSPFSPAGNRPRMSHHTQVAKFYDDVLNERTIWMSWVREDRDNLYP
jgi:hypothetical protein